MESKKIPLEMSAILYFAINCYQIGFEKLVFYFYVVKCTVYNTFMDLNLNLNEYVAGSKNGINAAKGRMCHKLSQT